MFDYALPPCLGFCPLPACCCSQTCCACSSRLLLAFHYVLGKILGSSKLGCLHLILVLPNVRHKRRCWGAGGGCSAPMCCVLGRWICSVPRLRRADLECFPQPVMHCRCSEFLLFNDSTPASCLSGTLLKTVFIFHTTNYSATIKGGEILFIAQGPASNRTLNSR